MMNRWSLALTVASLCACSLDTLEGGSLSPELADDIDTTPGGSETTDEPGLTQGLSLTGDSSSTGDAEPCQGACADDEVCDVDGTCQDKCAPGTTECGGACVDTSTDSAHCGACGASCGAGERCDGAGACTVCSSDRLIPDACTTSAPDEVLNCEKLYDAQEFAATPSTSGIDGLLCEPGGESSFCTYDQGCDNGCIRDVWIRFDLGVPRYVDRIRYMADWWAKRPDEWELWVSDDPMLTPDQGATRVTDGFGHSNPWVCTHGGSCDAPSVPDVCCPHGSNQPQDTSEVGDTWPRFDEQDFPGESGRYWYYVIRNTRFPQQALMFELELFGSECTG